MDSKKSASVVFLLLSLALLIGLWLVVVTSMVVTASDVVGEAASAIPGLPLVFVENVGQFRREGRFMLRHGNGVTWLGQDGLRINLLDVEALATAEGQWRSEGLRDITVPAISLRLSFVGANPAPVIEPFDRVGTRLTYLLGSAPENWRVDVPAWAGVRYRDLYPGVDLIVGGATEGKENPMLPWYLKVRPGADLGSVQLQVDGAYAAWVDGGEIALDTVVGRVSVPLLTARDKAGLEIGGAWSERRVTQTEAESFLVTVPLADPGADLSPAEPTDAADLIYSTYLGGSRYDYGYSVAVDGEGMVYVAGRTPSPDFPTTTLAYDPAVDWMDVFVSKISPAGAGVADLVYSTFIGGSSTDAGYGLALANGEAYVTGDTSSADFPTTSGAYDRTCGTDGVCNGWDDAFVVRLSADGTGLLYGTYLGGKDEETGSAIAVSGGEAYLTGFTLSEDLPTTEGAYDRTCGTDGRCNRSGQYLEPDAFLARLSMTGSGSNDLLYSTYLGGAARDQGNGIAVTGGDAFVTGESQAGIPGFGGYSGAYDAFVTRLDPGGKGTADLVYGTHVGGTENDRGYGIGLLGSTAWVAGATASADFMGGSVANSYGGGLYDAFAVQLDSTGTTVHAAFVGGADLDFGRDVAVDRAGGAVVVGYTRSMSDTFPVTASAYDTIYNGGNDAFVVRVDINSSEPEHITYGSYLGGTSNDDGYGVALDDQGQAFLTGNTDSTDFPTTGGAFSTVLSGGTDGFVTVLRVARLPALNVEKSTNGIDADEPPGLYLEAGEPVTWVYVARNAGDFVLNNVTITDDQLGIICAQASLAPEESVTCTAHAMAVEGQYANLGSVTGDPPEGLDPPSDSDLSHYFGAVPSIDLEKLTLGYDADAAPGPLVRSGTTVTWTYVVSNTGNVALTGISVADDQEGSASCPYTTLAPNKAMHCILTATAVVGAYGNSAGVTGTPPGGLPTVSDSDPSHYFGIKPIVSLEKSTSGEDTFPAPDLQIREGSPVTWTYLVSNTGDITLTNIRLEDDQIGMVSCPTDALAAEASMTCTATGIAQEGQYTNTGVVMGTPPVGSDVEASDVSHYYGIRLALAIQKLTNAQDADNAPGPWVEVGEVVTWTYLVTNTGNVALSEVVVMDDRLGTIDCVSDTLGVGQSMMCEVTGTAEPDQHANVATARGAYFGEVVEDSDPSHYFGMVPGVMIEKGTNGEDADAPPGPYLVEGSTVEWTYQVRNSGNVTLTQVTVGDDRRGPVACPKMVLAPGELMVCTTSGTVETGIYENLGTVTGNLPTGKTLAASDPSHYFGIYPEISIRKLTYDPGLLESVDAPEPPGPILLEGQIVTWTYVITNSGDITLTGISLVDDPQGVVECPRTSLAPLETMTCQLSGMAEAGQYANSGEVRGTHPAGGTVVASDRSHYFGVALRPVIDVLKTTNGVDANKPPGPLVPKGEPVRWEYLVSNVGNVPVEEISLSDDRVGSIDCDKTRLEVGKSMTCSAEGLAEAGQYNNTATVVGTGSTLTSTVPVSDTDVSYYFGTAPAIDLTKLTNGVEASVPPGPSIPIDEPVTWSYVIENTGNVPLSGIMVVDDNGTAGEVGDDVTVCTFSSLRPAVVRECTLEGLTIEGPYVNVATVTASYEGVPVLSADLSHYRGGVYQVYLPLVVRQGP